jgi:hypothetical protein
MTGGETVSERARASCGHHLEGGAGGSSYTPMSARPLLWSQATQRSPAAMLLNPFRRRIEIARLRSVASTWGAPPTRTWERSSSNTRSRTFSRGGARPAELDLRVAAGQ